MSIWVVERREYRGRKWRPVIVNVGSYKKAFVEAFRLHMKASLHGERARFRPQEYVRRGDRDES